MSANSDSSSSHTHASEESPLTASARRSSSEKELRSSLSGMIVEGIKRTFENFEFDVLSNRVSERGNDGSEKGDAVYDEIRGQNGRRRSGCCRVLIVIRIVFLCMLLMLMGASYGFGRWGWGIPFTNYNWDTSCCSYADPVMALKGSCALEDLENAAVATDHELCSEVGNSILLDGGNAVDAAVAAALCLGVANPSSSGLGGGAFILIHSDQANHESRSRSVKHPDFHDARDVTMTAGGAHMAKMTEAIDCREIAPGAATQDMYSSKPVDASSFGGFSVAVPGELKGLELAHARHGKLPWEKVVEPAMKMARDGFPIFSHLASDIKRTAEVTTKKHGEFPPLRKLLTKHDSWDSYLKEGDILKNPKLAETLQLITKVGSDGLYKGDLAKRLVDEVVEGGGILSVDDMANYLPTIRSPVVGNSNGFTLVGVPPPSSGGAVLIGAARFLSGYKSPLASARDTLAVHRTVEALRHAFAIRMSLSDPAYYTNATKTAVQDLISGDYMESLRRVTLDNSTLSLSMYGGEKWSKLHDSDGQSDADDAHEGDRRLRRSKNKVNLTRRLARRFGYLEDSGTSHLSIVDKEGNAVAMTTSVNNIFGSHVFSESTGVLLGNTMDGRSLPPRVSRNFNMHLKRFILRSYRLWNSWTKQPLRFKTIKRKLHCTWEKGK